MPVTALDHVNIRTRDVQASARFYVELLGLEARNGPMELPPEKVQWLYDAHERPIIHLNSFTPIGEGSTGPIDHVALACSGKAEMLERLTRMGAEFQVNEMASIGLTQIFTRDPHGVLLELNFRGD
jgi:catechol 2,3-dioxygenase-like lactoylglutathione lyase family enzyme